MAPAREAYPVVAVAVVLGEESAEMRKKIWSTRGAKAWMLAHVSEIVNIDIFWRD